MADKNYSLLAEFYSYLMRKVDYPSWADYLEDIIYYLDIEPKSMLEVASGNCAIADVLVNKYPSLIATDLSLPMLKRSNNKMLNKIACDMRELPFKGKFDFIFSTFDSVNYLITLEDLNAFFAGINRVLNNDGIFTFDVSLEKNSIKYEKDLNRTGKFNNIKFKQISDYDRGTKIHTNTFYITDANGHEYIEEHKQRIYDLVEYFEIIENNGMFVIDCFEAFTFENANLNTERAQFIVGKE